MRGISDREQAEDVAEQLFLALDKDKNDVLTEKEFVLGARNSSAIIGLLSGP